jgi:hypothetical protein
MPDLFSLYRPCPQRKLPFLPSRKNPLGHPMRDPSQPLPLLQRLRNRQQLYRLRFWSLFGQRGLPGTKPLLQNFRRRWKMPFMLYRSYPVLFPLHHPLQLRHPNSRKSVRNLSRRLLPYQRSLRSLIKPQSHLRLIQWKQLPRLPQRLLPQQRNLLPGQPRLPHLQPEHWSLHHLLQRPFRFGKCLRKHWRTQPILLNLQRSRLLPLQHWLRPLQRRLLPRQPKLRNLRSWRNLSLLRSRRSRRLPVFSKYQLRYL